MSLVELKQISMSYGSKKNPVQALAGVDLKIEKGEFVSVVGKSGCGKSTLLNVLGGITKPDSGEYVFDGIQVSGLSNGKLAGFRKEKIGFVVQHFALIQDMNVYNNIALPLVYQKYAKKDIEKKVMSVMERLGVVEKRYSYPYELSGGQQQRIAIARAIVAEPELLLADEPTGALDEQTGETVFEELKQLNADGMTILLVTHDMELARQCKRIVKMKDGKCQTENL